MTPASFNRCAWNPTLCAIAAGAKGPFFDSLWLCLVIGVWWASSSAFGLDISEPQWGFDGRVRLHRFNLLTITVDNPSPQPVELEMELRKSRGMDSIDAKLVEPIFLAPGARRTVQFYPYITDDWGSWRLSIGRDSIDIQQPRVSRRGARVLLDSADVLGDSKGNLKRFPDHQFPASVTGTDNLEAVVLDHVPNWDEPRRQAFLDWLHRGGTVVVLQGSNGKLPTFSGALAPLNSPLDSHRFGSGLIRRRDQTRGQLTREEARSLWAVLPNRAPAEMIPGQPMPANLDEDEEDTGYKQGFQYGDGGGGAFSSSSYLSELKAMTRPEHNWLLLHLMFWVYILLIFPGCYLVGKHRNDFRVVYLALIGTVAIFSLAFGIVGQRGYGESTTVHSVAIVSPLPDGQLDVAQWSNVFVTGGAIYDIRHKGTGTLYSTCQETEAVNGFIKNGAEALFRVDIPPFSSREFAHRIKAAGALPNVRVERFATENGGLKELALAVDGTFPKTDELVVLYRDRFYSLYEQKAEGRLMFRSSVGSVPAYLRVEQNQNNYNPWISSQHEETPEQRYQKLFHPLATRSLNIRNVTDANAVRWAPDRVRLMYYADLLPELFVQNTRFTNQKGKALYCIDLPVPEEILPAN